MRVIRYVFFFMGLVVFAFGIALAIQVKHLGLHPWDVLNVALNEHFGLTIGTWSVVVGLLLVCVTFAFDRRYISVGTFLNAILIGPIMDLFLRLHFLPRATHTWLDYITILCGIVISGIGGGMYVSAGVGAGPRDGFMLSISDKTGLSVTRARIIVESCVLVVGLILGGPVFIVTFIYTFIQSPVFQQSLKLFKKYLLAIENCQTDTNATSEAL